MTHFKKRKLLKKLYLPHKETFYDTSIIKLYILLKFGNLVIF